MVCRFTGEDSRLACGNARCYQCRVSSGIQDKALPATTKHPGRTWPFMGHSRRTVAPIDRNEGDERKRHSRYPWDTTRCHPGIRDLHEECFTRDASHLEERSGIMDPQEQLKWCDREHAAVWFLKDGVRIKVRDFTGTIKG